MIIMISSYLITQNNLMKIEKSKSENLRTSTVYFKNF